MKKSERKKALLAKFPKPMATRIGKICKPRPSLRAAIDLFCVECMGCDPGYSVAIRECAAQICPLYDLRPFQGAK